MYNPRVLMANHFKSLSDHYLLTRCSMTTVDPSTGVKDSSGEPLMTLKM